MFWYVSYCLEAFGTVSLPYKSRCKTGGNCAINSKVRATKLCIFHNERSISTPLDPKLIFWYVSYCLDAFGTVLLPCETRCKTGWKGAINAKVHAMKSCWNSEQLTPGSTHWTLNSCFGVFRTIWLYLGPFRCLKKLGGKWDEMEQLMQKFMPWSPFGIFRNDRSRSTPLEPELMFWYVSYTLGAIGIVSLPHKTRCKTGGNYAINSKVRATK